MGQSEVTNEDSRIFQFKRKLIEQENNLDAIKTEKRELESMYQEYQELMKKNTCLLENVKLANYNNPCFSMMLDERIRHAQNVAEQSYDEESIRINKKMKTIEKSIEETKTEHRIKSMKEDSRRM